MAKLPWYLKQKGTGICEDGTTFMDIRVHWIYMIWVWIKVLPKVIAIKGKIIKCEVI